MESSASATKLDEFLSFVKMSDKFQSLFAAGFRSVHDVMRIFDNVRFRVNGNLVLTFKDLNTLYEGGITFQMSRPEGMI